MPEIDTGTGSEEGGIRGFVSLCENGKLIGHLNYNIKPVYGQGIVDRQIYVEIIPLDTGIKPIRIENNNLIEGDPNLYLDFIKTLDGGEFFSQRPEVGKVLSDLVEKFSKKS